MKPKILIYDIETAPNLAYVWGKYDQNVIDFKEQRSLLSFSYSYVGSNTIHHCNRSGDKSDLLLVTKLADLLQEADIVVAHNGDQFDRKVLKTRMLYHGMNPLKPNCSVDTKKAAKLYFSFNGNSLDDLCQYLGIGSKLKNMPFSVWLGCMADKRSSWSLMKKYNNHDVYLLKRVYKRLLPWIENHPTLLEPGERGKCLQCGSDNLQYRGVFRAAKGVYRRFRCKSCGKWGKGATVIK
jgi:hypothetical protein